ncbi:MAG: mevalonate kinase [Promethearchaeota archaeon]
MPLKITCSAPGKIILAGEHAVVHGYPAIVTTINKRSIVELIIKEKRTFTLILSNLEKSIHDNDWHRFVKKACNEFPLLGRAISLIQERFPEKINQECCVTNARGFEIKIHSKIPIGAGLGSSATISACLLQALLMMLNIDGDKQLLMELSHEAEKLFHSAPSGIDTTAAILGGVFLFQSEKLIDKINKIIDSDGIFLIADSKVPRNTGKMVMKVKKLLEKKPEFVTRRFEIMKNVALELWEILTSGKIIINEIGKKFTDNHVALRDLGLSTPELENIARISMDCGATGCKITGAGGGGTMLIAAPTRAKKVIIESLAARGFPAFPAQLENNGLISNKS